MELKNYLNISVVIHIYVPKSPLGSRAFFAHIIKLNLRHNRITVESFPYIRNILFHCPNIYRLII